MNLMKRRRMIVKDDPKDQLLTEEERAERFRLLSGIVLVIVNSVPGRRILAELRALEAEKKKC